MVVAPYEIHLKSSDARAKLAQLAADTRARNVAREGRPLCADDLREVPNEQPVSSSAAVVDWLVHLLPPDPVAFPVENARAIRDSDGDDEVGEDGTSAKQPETAVVTSAIAQEVNELRRRRNERFGPWFAAAGLRSHWFSSLLPLEDDALRRETDEVFRRVTSSAATSSSSLSMLRSPQSLHGSVANDSVVSRGSVADLSGSLAGPTAGAGSGDHSSSEADSSAASVLAPVLVWLLSRTMTELFPGLEDAEAKNFAREDIKTATVHFDAFAAMLLVLLEPWCFTAADAVAMLREFVVEHCLAPTYGTMPAALTSSFRLPPVLASPSPHRNSMGNMSNQLLRNGSISRNSFAATRGSVSPTRQVFSPTSVGAPPPLSLSPTPVTKLLVQQRRDVGSGGQVTTAGPVSTTTSAGVTTAAHASLTHSPPVKRMASLAPLHRIAPGGTTIQRNK